MGKRNFFGCICVIFGLQVVTFLPLLHVFQRWVDFFTTPVIAGVFLVIAIVDIFAIALSCAASDNWIVSSKGDNDGTAH